MYQLHWVHILSRWSTSSYVLGTNILSRWSTSSYVQATLDVLSYERVWLFLCLRTSRTTLCILSTSLKYSTTFGSSLKRWSTAVAAWHACATVAPSGHLSAPLVRSPRRQIYCTKLRPCLTAITGYTGSWKIQAASYSSKFQQKFLTLAYMHTVKQCINYKLNPITLWPGVTCSYILRHVTTHTHAHARTHTHTHTRTHTRTHTYTHTHTLRLISTHRGEK